MELLCDDTDHIVYLTSNNDPSYNDPFVKKVQNRKISLPSIIYYDEHNDCWTSTSSSNFTNTKENDKTNKVLLDNYVPKKKKTVSELIQEEGKEEYMFEGMIDAITGEPISGKAINPQTKEAYEGNFISGLRSDNHGYGTNLQMFGGLKTKYFGKWVNNEPSDGIVITKRYTYIGKLYKGRFVGRGWLAKSNLVIYDGEFYNGLFHGIGKQSYNTNNDDAEPSEEFSGEFYYGVRQGIGTLRKKGYVYSGMWCGGVREGEGSEIITDANSNDEEYVGQFLRDKRHGFGMMTRHGVVCEGQWRRGVPADEAWVVSYPDGRKYLGGLRHWMPHGKGIMIYSSSKGNELVHIGAFDNGKYVKDSSSVTVDVNGVHCRNPQESDLVLTLGQTTDNSKINASTKSGAAVDLLHGMEEMSGSFDEEEMEEVVLSSQRQQTATTDGEEGDQSHNNNNNNIYLKRTEYYENGDIYHGQVDSYGRREGYGHYTQHTTGGTYEGAFSKNERHGSGILFIPGHLKFCGDFYHDYIHGYGTLVFEDTSSYNGHFINNKFHGKGTLCESDGSIYVGHFRHGLRHGDGMEKYSDGKVFLGEYHNGKRNGIGTLLDKENGKVLYSGKWQDDLMDGYGVQIGISTSSSCFDRNDEEDSNDDEQSSNKNNENNNKSIINEQFEGHFICGQRSGEGTLTLSNGYILQGVWLRDKPKTPEKWNVTYPNGNHYTGDAIMHPTSPSSIIPTPHGSGRLKYANGDIYEGEFYHGKRHGNGLCIYVNWDTWRGAWSDDSIDIHGGGELRLNNGTIRRFYNKEKKDAPQQQEKHEGSVNKYQNHLVDKDNQIIANIDDALELSTKSLEDICLKK